MKNLEELCDLERFVQILVDVVLGLDLSLVFVFLVAFTGLLTQTVRLLDTPFLAYNIYFVHMVFIFFLLWYAPYSKLAHMFYRTLALVYLKQNGRDNKDVFFKDNGTIENVQVAEKKDEIAA